MFSEVKKVQQMHRFFLVLVRLIVQAPTFTEASLLLSYKPPLYFLNNYKKTPCSLNKWHNKQCKVVDKQQNSPCIKLCKSVKMIDSF